MRWLVWVFAMLLTTRAANAALVFQDRHTDARGVEITYSFESNSQETGSQVDRTKAGKIAASWATQYYKIQPPLVVDAQARTMPIHFWLIQLLVPVGGKPETFYAVVLPSGSIVEPRADRKPVATATLVDRDSYRVSFDPTLAAPEKKLEIHGEISFTYGFGKGSGCGYPYVDRGLNPPFR
jgi:hypothetical protein